MKTMNSAYGTSYLHLFNIWFRYSPPLPPPPPPIHLIFSSNFSLVTLISRALIVRGLPQSTTEDTVLNYFENTRRSGGGAVEEVKIEGSVARVKFESSEGNLVIMFTFIKSGDELISRDQLCNFVTKSRLKFALL